MIDLLARIAAPHLAAGAAIRRADGTEDAWAWGRAAPEGAPAPLDPHLRLRAASITKGALGRLAAVLAVAGELDLGAPHPLPPGPPVTLAALLSHTSGLRDAAGYLPGPRETARDLAPRARVAPGPFFYANLNALVAAELIEEITEERIDLLLAAHVLRPAGIHGGLNWAGVADRSARLPLWQRRGDALVLTADGGDWPWHADAVAGGEPVDLRAYRLGRDTARLSPHAGLRASLPELARLAALFGADDAAGRLQRRVLWRHDGTNGETAGGLFPAQGLSLTPFETGPAGLAGLAGLAGPAGPLAGLTGHAGHALGLTGGAWFDACTGAGLAYTITGVADATQGLDTETFLSADELALLEALRAHA